MKKTSWISFPYIIYIMCKSLFYQRYQIRDLDKFLVLRYILLGTSLLILFSFNFIYKFCSYILIKYVTYSSSLVITVSIILMYFYGVIITEMLHTYLQKKNILD